MLKRRVSTCIMLAAGFRRCYHKNLRGHPGYDLIKKISTRCRRKKKGFHWRFVLRPLGEQLSRPWSPCTLNLRTWWVKKWLYAFIFSADTLEWQFSPQSTIVCNSYKLRMLGILLMCLFVPFFYYTQCSFYYWHGSSSKEPHLSISISRSSYLLILLHSLIDMLLSVSTDISIRRH